MGEGSTAREGDEEYWGWGRSQLWTGKAGASLRRERLSTDCTEVMGQLGKGLPSRLLQADETARIKILRVHEQPRAVPRSSKESIKGEAVSDEGTRPPSVERRPGSCK